MQTRKSLVYCATCCDVRVNVYMGESTHLFHPDSSPEIHPPLEGWSWAGQVDPEALDVLEALEDRFLLGSLFAPSGLRTKVAN